MVTQAVGEAPGRVNLLGEHTDYNDGFVLPIAIPQKTRVSVEHAQRFEVHSDSPGHDASRYIAGCIEELGTAVPPLRFEVHSDVPIGAGLSSSAALEVATLRALRTLLGLSLDDVQIALIAQQAEIRHAGVRCGIMDQMACSLAEASRALFLDTRTLERRLVPLPAGAEIAVVDSGMPRSLAQSGYNTRRAECEEAARLLGCPSLREVNADETLGRLPPHLRRRVRHVVTENARVLRAADGVPAAVFGELMSASHASLRDDYDVSTPELDALVAALASQPGVYGARLTGAGFGGACVALCRAGGSARAVEAALEQYKVGGRRGRRLV
ncbi:MAG TPA: galactokinase [Burkholderiales bacterium]|nr:galactokinase [Burkholderiales bacterium]